MSRIGDFGDRLYRGEVSYDFMGRRRVWYAIAASLILLSLVAMVGRGLNFNVDFRGGSELVVSGANCSVEQARETVVGTGLGGEPTVQTVGGSDVRVQVGELAVDESRRLQQALAQACGVPVERVSANFVGPSWGADVSSNALRGLAVFLVLVVIFLSLYFEWRMAVAALLALVHDLVLTAGIYALVGFEVSPATVIGLLTVLGYSLYDTVVVFDKVKENTAGILGGSRSTYAEAANLAVNQTLVRSINTSIISLLPVAAIFFIGAGLFGAGTLKDLSLVLLVGLAAGAYSSIFIATPFLVQLKEREPAVQALAKRVSARRAGGRPTPATRAGATALTATAEPPAAVDAPEGRAAPRPGNGEPVPMQGGLPGTARPAGQRNATRRTGSPRQGPARRRR